MPCTFWQETATVRSMPDAIAGKLTTAYMRDGTGLCGAYQLGRCQDDSSQCQGVHKCAIMLRTGRACGGSHPAQACFDKRFVPEPAKREWPSSGSGSGQEATDRDSKAEYHFGHWQKHMGRRTPHEGLRESPGRISLVGGLAKIPDTSFHHRFLCRSCASWCTSRERYSWEWCHRREKTPSRSLVAAATLTCPAFSNTIRWVNGSTTWSRHIGAYSGSASSDGVHRCCQIQCLLDALWWHPPMFAQAGPEQSSSPVSGADSDRRWQGSPVLAPTTLPSMLNQGLGRALHPVPKIRYRSGGEHMSPVLTPCPLCAELLDLLGMDPFQIQLVEREPLSP